MSSDSVTQHGHGGFQELHSLASACEEGAEEVEEAACHSQRHRAGCTAAWDPAGPRQPPGAVKQGSKSNDEGKQGRKGVLGSRDQSLPPSAEEALQGRPTANLTLQKIAGCLFSVSTVWGGRPASWPHSQHREGLGSGTCSTLFFFVPLTHAGTSADGGMCHQ